MLEHFKLATLHFSLLQTFTLPIIIAPLFLLSIHYHLHLPMQSTATQSPKADQCQYLFHVQLLGPKRCPVNALIKVNIPS